jgi:LPXTG-motif cell wall-anchored protein
MKTKTIIIIAVGALLIGALIWYAVKKNKEAKAVETTPTT